MTLKWASNENPVTSSKLNKLCVTQWTNEAAIDTAQVGVGSLVYLEDKTQIFRVKTVSPLVLVAIEGGGGSTDYPNWSWLEGKDHFNRVTLEPGGPDLYLGLGSSTSFGIYAAGNDEYYSHAATPEGNLTTATQGGFYASYSVWHTKNDKDKSFTKAVAEFKVKFVRTANLILGFGLIDGTAANGSPLQTVDKIVVTVSGTGNFTARVSDGAAESTLDCGVSDDNFHKWRIEWTSTQIEIFLDGVSKGTITTNKPDRPLQPAPHLIRNDTGANDGLRDVIMDYWHCKME